MGGDGERRKKKDRDRERERGRSRGSDNKRDRKRDPEASWFLRLVSGRACLCSQVSCASVDKIDARDRSRRREKDKMAKEQRRRRRKANDEQSPQSGDRGDCGSGQRAAADGGTLSTADYDDGASERDSDRSCTSYASESEYSRPQSVRSARSERQASQRSERTTSGGKDPSEGNASRCAKGNMRGGGTATSGVKVMNLADLRGQELPESLEAKTASECPSAKGRGAAPQYDDAEDAPLSARSGRSEGARSLRSVRSEGAQSAGGMSVKSAASVSVRQYMGYLSERKSPAEVKKMVKEFVRQMVKGREMGVLCADGTLKPVMCGLTRALDTFKIKSGEQTRKVKLSEVERLVFGNPEELNDLETPLDEMCSTLELDSSECISFKFAERKAAELFTLCMQLFVDGQRAK